jgi:hypothetical protein
LHAHITSSFDMTYLILDDRNAPQQLSKLDMT